MTAPIAAVGRGVARRVSQSGALARFFLSTIWAWPSLPRAGRSVTWHVLINQVWFTAVQAVPLVIVLAGLSSFLVISQAVRELGRLGSTELIVTYDSGRQDRKAASLEMRVPHSIVPYQNVMDAMVESFGPPTWSKIAPEPKFDQSVMTWESDACDIYVTVFHKRTKSHAFRGDSLVVQMKALASKKAATEAFE